MVINSLTSKNPAAKMNELVKIAQNTVTICNMIKSVSLFFHKDPLSVKTILQAIQSTE